ncbi:Surfeit locus 1 family protein [Haematobacter massiliensis]|uniref:SURF1-like protein n=1 Tax=Haematobacter massiliensis TaxID=195105 RepID=A0A086YB56_9RHOB|nr:SURF1 family protein [Haematobacter massiliensis]KFI31506.1 Surfeit locus 1 family protein [Haematobacter massiliensis]
MTTKGHDVQTGRGDTERAPRSPLRMAVIAAIGLLLTVCLIALGWWQVERRAWKHDLVARVDARIHAAPVVAPGPAAWPVGAETDEYRRVVVTGTFDHSREALVQALTDLGAGFWVLTPLATDQGFTVLVNRGFVPSDQRDAASRAQGEIPGSTTVTGLLRLTEPGGGFLRSNDPAGDRWYSRDVSAIADARSLSGTVAPYFIDADATPNPGGLPVGGLTVVHFPDNHLSYALTWFALAAGMAGCTIFVLRHETGRRRRA